MTAPRPAGRTLYRLYQLAWTGLDWLYPPRCGGCSQLHQRWCPECQAQARRLPDRVCRRCGEPLARGALCAACADRPPAYQALRSWGFFEGPLRGALHRLKYQRDIALGEALARHLVQLLGELGWPVDLVTAVPAGVARLRERGYNQATFLAIPPALAFGVPYRSKALVKLRDTPTQVGLNAAQRRANIAGAFAAQPALVDGRQVLVIDDVTTTGATIQACAEALLSSGARQVYGLTLARAV
ncbi:MAG: ComF family protein [Chloroflexota bacterium]